MEVRYFEYHTIPFDLNLPTEGDLLTLDKLFRIKRIRFLNLKTNMGRSCRIYERLYALYVAATDMYADPYVVSWRDVIVSGWPENISHSHGTWNTIEIGQLEAILDSEGIQFKMTDKFKDEIDRLQISMSSFSTESFLEDASDFDKLLASEYISDIPDVHIPPAASKNFEFKRLKRNKSAEIFEKDDLSH